VKQARAGVSRRPNYYGCSNNPKEEQTMKAFQSPLAILLVTAAAATGCAHQERTVLKFPPDQGQSLASFDPHKQSIIAHLQEGDVVPLDIVVEGDLIGAVAGTSVPLTVKRECWVRVDDRGFRLSADGKDFDAKARIPGAFQLGLGITPAGPRATLKLTTPQR
jgi:hypothetical protein